VSGGFFPLFGDWMSHLSSSVRQASFFPSLRRSSLGRRFDLNVARRVFGSPPRRFSTPGSPLLFSCLPFFLKKNECPFLLCPPWFPGSLLSSPFLPLALPSPFLSQAFARRSKHNHFGTRSFPPNSLDRSPANSPSVPRGL